jgi:DegV family protein with EDD domain
MSRIAIVTDSTAYLPPEVIAQYKIPIVPLKVHWKGNTYLDGIDLKPGDFYPRLEKETELPTTSQPSIQDFVEIFERLAQDHDGIIAPLISSGISGTVGSAQAAVEQFTRIPVSIIDTHSTAVGLTLAVLAAARAIDAGKNLVEVTEITQSVVARMRTFFIVDTLKYLHMGGRIGGATRYLGSALNIKPILYFNEEGKIDALERVRTRGKALERLVGLAQETAGGKSAHLSIVHGAVPERAELMKKMLSDAIQCEEIHILELSPVIGTHVGTGAIGVAVYADSV